jgi:hypothetical protein
MFHTSWRRWLKNLRKQTQPTPRPKPTRRFRPRIEALEDRTVPSTFTVTTTADSGSGSLRQAILSANADASAGTDLINFNIPVTDAGHVYYKNDGVPGQLTQANVTPTTAADDSTIADIDPDWAHSWWTIQPTSRPLPFITHPVTIDGYSQPGSVMNSTSASSSAGLNGILRIELDGSGTGNGLFLLGGNSAVQGLVINRANSNVGLWIWNPGLDGNNTVGTGNTIQGDYLGTNIAGTASLGRGGLYVYTNSNTVGGSTAAARNILSGRSGANAVYIFDADSNVVQGNFSGINAAGTTALAEVNIEIRRGNHNLIGGTDPGARNLIVSGGSGVTITGSPSQADGNIVQGNYIGTNAAGSALVIAGGAAGSGIGVSSATNTLVGGTVPGAGNVISGFYYGVSIFSVETPTATGNVVQGNFIGTDATGRIALGNQQAGVSIAALTSGQCQ